MLILVCILPAYTAGASEGTLSVAGPWDVTDADPHAGGSTMMQRLGVIETLVDVDQSASMVPGLATSWQASGDQLTWTFTLRDGVKFHDGTAFTAKAMKKSLEDSLKKSKTFVKIPLKEIKAPSDSTLEIILTKPFPVLPAYFASGKSAALSEACIDQGNITKPIGTGPFKFESYSPKEEMIVVKNPDYWGKKASIKEVDYKVVPEASTRSMMLESGDVDIAQIMPADISESYASKSGFTVHTQPISRYRTIVYNCEKNPFVDERVRQAMNYAIDRQALVDYVLEGVGTSGAGIYPSGFYWENKAIVPFTSNPEKAKSLLAEAGWKDTDGDGILDKDGAKFSISMVTYSERAELPKMAEVIQDELKKIGIEAEITTVDSNTASNMKNKGEFDMYVNARMLFSIPDPDEIMTDYHSSTTFSNEPSGAYRWSDKRVDELVESARVLTDPAERKKMYDEVQQIVVDKAPASILNYYVNQDITSSKVRGYRMHPTELSYHLEDATLS
jgi:peptide/nickel transport system substrate-binding protein